jgi:hypothetical protein
MLRVPNRVIFREYDKVRVINPIFVQRVGYPKCPADYKKQATDLFYQSVRVSTLPWVGEKMGRTDAKMIDHLAWYLCAKDGHGGNRRSIHTVEYPEFQGATAYVSSKRTVKTGTRVGGDWEEGPSFDVSGTHVLVTLTSTVRSTKDNLWNAFTSDPLEIDSCNLEKIE